MEWNKLWLDDELADATLRTSAGERLQLLERMEGAMEQSFAGVRTGQHKAVRFRQ